jgi:hypothetical protein
MEELVKKIYTMKYYSAIKIKEVLLFAVTWVSPRDIMLSEIELELESGIGSKYCMLSHVETKS